MTKKCSWLTTSDIKSLSVATLVDLQKRYFAAIRDQQREVARAQRIEKKLRQEIGLRKKEARLGKDIPHTANVG